MRLVLVRTPSGGAWVFFQAEDGIRDLTVTGVQTCALPISRWWRSPRWRLPVAGGPWRDSRRARGGRHRGDRHHRGGRTFLGARRGPGGEVTHREIGRASCRERV